MIRSTFAAPVLIAIASFGGLVIALTGDGWRDAAGWAGLCAPIIAIGWAVRARRNRKDHRC